MNISLRSIYKLVVFPQGKWNWIFIGYKVCGDSHILAESFCISVNAEVSVLSAVLGSSWSVRSLAKECATHPLLLEPEIRTVRTLVMGSWRRKLIHWTISSQRTIIGTLSLIFQCFAPLVGDHTALTLNPQIAYRFRPLPGKAFFGPRDPLKRPPLVKAHYWRGSTVLFYRLRWPTTQCHGKYNSSWQNKLYLQEALEQDEKWGNSSGW